ncbi:hypothetical protein LTR39_002864 [Cryomyces antarcticus]|nr:hypothetical protein LTR39_002864 [Cryomyces antarcticus]
MPTPTRDFWSTLLASATRRKSAGQTHTSSPLALHPVEPTTATSDWTNKETTLAAPKHVKMSSGSTASADAAGLGRFHAALPSLKELLGLPTPALSASSVRSAVSGVRSTLAPVEKKDVFMGGTEDLDVGMLMG